MLKIELITLLVCLGQIFERLQTVKILAGFGIPHPAENVFAASLLKALHERGHDITVVIRFSNNMGLHSNIKTINIDANNDLFMEFFSISGGNFDDSLLLNVQKFYDKNAVSTLNFMKNHLVKQMMKDEHFDLVILDTLMSEALYGLGEYFKAPMMGVSNFLTNQPVDDLVGNFSPISTIPSFYIQHTFETKLLQRCINVALTVFDKQIFNYFHMPNQRKLYKEMFPNASLTFDQAKRNFSLVLLNQHFSLSFPRPYVPNMIEVAGLYIEDSTKVLPLRVQQFLSDSVQQVIYISLSADAQTLNVSPNSLLMLNLLHVLKDYGVYGVIWHMHYLPPGGNNSSNILQISNISCTTVLKQPQVKLFITNGDIQSVIEAVYYARPILGLPLFGDQHLNMNMVVKAGYGLSTKFIALNEDKIKQAVLELLNNHEYFQTIERLSIIFRDQPTKPKEKAIYWIEYILRYDGSLHLMSKGRF